MRFQFLLHFGVVKINWYRMRKEDKRSQNKYIDCLVTIGDSSTIQALQLLYSVTIYTTNDRVWEATKPS